MKTRSIILSLIMLVALVSLTSATAKSSTENKALVKHCGSWTHSHYIVEEWEPGVITYTAVQKRTCTEEVPVTYGVYPWTYIVMTTVTTTEYRDTPSV